MWSLWSYPQIGDLTTFDRMRFCGWLSERRDVLDQFFSCEAVFQFVSFGWEIGAHFILDARPGNGWGECKVILSSDELTSKNKVQIELTVSRAGESAERVLVTADFDVKTAENDVRIEFLPLKARE